MYPFNTVADVKKSNIAIGSHFFDKDTMRFFNSRIESELINGRFFVTSEYQNERSEKKYSIRMANNNGTIETIYKFQNFTTLKEAKKAAKNLPKSFYEAYEAAKSEWNGTPTPGQRFTDYAETEPAHSRENAFHLDSFCVACTYIACNYQRLNIPYVEALIKDSELLSKMNAQYNKLG